ncbi:urea hydro-lyase cyanamide [Xylariales sp. PMI_506]|nr:urea hydro-lyase cyanamide [Xylariales sp. PMI_506]
MSSSTPAASAEDIAKHGWTAVPVDSNVIFGNKPYLHEPAPMTIAEIPFPSDDPIVAEVQAYAKEQLSEPTYNHSMRVYYFGYCIMAHQFPEHAAVVSPATWALTCLLHDIGTTPEHLRSTLLSFEWFGGILARDMLSSRGAPRAQSDAVAEAIIRHQDLGTVGRITFLGQLVQLATIYDNIGARPQLVHPTTRDAVVAAFPRRAWSGCFAATIREELGFKPWAHTTHLGEHDFPDGVLANQLMAPYEEAEKK